MIISRESKSEFIVMSAGDALQSNIHNDFSVESPYNDYFRVLMRAKLPIFWLFVYQYTEIVVLFN